jgi:hypothetical protein
MEMDIRPFQNQGLHKPIRSCCPFCGVEIFCALLILADLDLHRLYTQIAGIVSMANPETTHLMGKDKA